MFEDSVIQILTHLTGSIPPTGVEAYAGLVMGVNYGFDKVRFVSPVKVNARIRLQRKLLDSQLKNPNQIQLTHECTIEVEGEPKPACVAQWLTLLSYA